MRIKNHKYGGFDIVNIPYLEGDITAHYDATGFLLSAYYKDMAFMSKNIKRTEAVYSILGDLGYRIHRKEIPLDENYYGKYD